MTLPAVARLDIRPFDIPLNEPFAIAGGAKTEAKNILVRAELSDGTVGWGEGAPSINDGSREKIMPAAKNIFPKLLGRPIASWRALLETLDDSLGTGPAKAAVGMALLDAWTRRLKIPLSAFFGGSQRRVYTDVTVTLAPPEASARSARRIVALGVKVIKIKVGGDMDQDEARVRAVDGAGRGLKLMLDANCGYSARQSLRFLARLKKRGIKPVLFEQPAPKDDWRGLKDVLARGGVPVAADESVQGPKDMIAAAALKAISVVNIKLMKSGFTEGLDIARIAKSAGIGLMIGGMVESPLAMGAGAHFAAGLGGFSFIDLDTPLWFSRNPMRGLLLGRGGLYDLAPVKAGIGVLPKPELLALFPRRGSRA
ncbi:MAG: dipeptide epimerase [Elusimicrobia bacterium]|nr:dipeptide epimerase [Elusimicrobiota bacterium]